MFVQELIILRLFIFSAVLYVTGNSERTTFPDYINASSVETQSEEICDHYDCDSDSVVTARVFYEREAFVSHRDFQHRRLGNRNEGRGARTIQFYGRSNARGKLQSKGGHKKPKSPDAGIKRGPKKPKNSNTGNEKRHKEPNSGGNGKQTGSIPYRSLGNPLILTPYIKNNHRGAGIKAAKVQPLINGVISYSGFFEVNEKKKSFMFFWFFHARSNQPRRSDSHQTPVIVWLQGGLGRSSLYGALRLNGPIRLEDNGSLTWNKYSWAEKAHLVYFDSLVGAGYSYTKKFEFSRNQESVASNLYSALKQFLTLFHLAENPLYITGQSYAGKYVVSLGAKIHHEKKNFYINLNGVAIGNGFIDPPNMLRYGPYLYQLGFIDLKQRDEFKTIKTSIVELLKENKEEKARDMYADWIEGDLDRTRPCLVERIIGPGMVKDYRRVKRGVNEAYILNKFLNEDRIKKMLNVGKTPYMNDNERARRAIWGDLLKPQVQNLQLLLKGYRVLLYQGQTSVKYSYPLVYNYITKMKWKGRRAFLEMRTPMRWMVDGQMAGFIKKGGRLSELVVRNAGRNVPSDQPKWAQRMIEDFISHKG